MNIRYSLLIVLVTAISTLATRVVPFLLFGTAKQEVPRAISYLGRVLPPAVMAALVVYSVKHISFLDHTLWMNEIIGVIVTAVVHLWRRNTLVSIAAGTGIYMVLVQTALL
ncbi:MAG TPA: AzlD domain-containing protein [Sphaerochaetaceae bacterium]|jgi:branched-subunit amino acid transport protein AzlD|nr:AzlD domain-containing protein [Sphaerochaetaceae bacterium]